MKPGCRLDPAEVDRLAPRALALLAELAAGPPPGPRELDRLLRRHSLPGGGTFGKPLLGRLYRQLAASGRLAPSPELERRLQVKAVRTLSGTAPVAVLTRPHPCPGNCLFCPDEPGLPRSYLAGEPGAERARRLGFDPLAQVRVRLQALAANGHCIDKVELLVLGGTWSAYPAAYQEWFLTRCLDALNGREAPSLAAAQEWNRDAPHRNTGLVVETRPDLVDATEVRRLRHLGVTKVQLGAQALDDGLLARSGCGYTVHDIKAAVARLRAAGFKLVLHWMPNLPGATPASDREGFARLWSDPGLRPDELKIYPCVAVASAGLAGAWRRGEWQPYPEEQLIDLVASCKRLIPPWCRVNRIQRDIPAPAVLAGSRRADLRERVRARLRAAGEACRCIRCRELGAGRLGEARPVRQAYAVAGGEELFLGRETREGRLAAWLRLHLPELAGAALVRELHVVGRALPLGVEDGAAAQHQGLGEDLLAEAAAAARAAGFRRLAVIAAVGTRGYYERRGYRRDGDYMVV